MKSKSLLLGVITVSLLMISCNNKVSDNSLQKKDSLTLNQTEKTGNLKTDSLTSDNSNPEENDIAIDPNASPENVVKVLIKAGKTGKYKTIAKICNDAVDKDGDAREICDIANASPADQLDFNDFFGNATIVGKARIRNGIAEVDIKTTAEGGDKETIIVQNKYDRWYLKGL